MDCIIITIQEVVDFLQGYEHNLKQKGFSFDYLTEKLKPLKTGHLV